MEGCENEGGPPNALFISYLSKLREKSLNRKDGRSVVLYDKALDSLRRYPLPLRSVKEARKLKHVGPRVEADLEACMAKYGGAPPPSEGGKRATVVVQEVEDADNGRKQKRQKHDEVVASEVAEDASGAKYEWSEGDQVVLVVDHRELARKRGAKLEMELERLGVQLESKVLALADMAWIVRDKRGVDWMLRHAVERKTVSDLSSSIKDGRYREQKFRLSLAQLTRVAYLVEGSLKPSAKYAQKAAYSLLPAETLEAAIASTAYGSSGFVVQRCSDMAHTARWLLAYTRQLQALLPRPELRDSLLFGFGLAAFNDRNKKELNPTVSDIFAKQLLAVAGVSGKKIVPLVARFATLSGLWEAYEKCDSKEKRRALLASTQLSENRTLGPVAATAIAKAIFPD